MSLHSSFTCPHLQTKSVLKVFLYLNTSPQLSQWTSQVVHVGVQHNTLVLVFITRQTLLLKMPITCKTSDVIREIHSNISQRKKWSNFLPIIDSTSEACDASTGTGGLMLPKKQKRSLRHHTQPRHPLCPHLD